MNSRSQLLVPSLSLSLLLGLGCGQAHGPALDAGLKAKPISVETIAVGERDMPNNLPLAGTLKANQESDLAANATGRVLRTMVERGSYVSKGQPIAQLDVKVAQLSASEAEANVDTARTQKSAAEEECTRYDRLFKRGVITQQEYDRQTTSCKTATSSTVAAETRVALAKETLSNGTVRAPFSGLVSERFVAVGEYVLPSTKVAHLVDIDPLRLEMTIPAESMNAVKQGGKVDFQVGAFPDRTFSGTVHYIGPAVRATTRDLVFEAAVPNKDKLLRPGLFATAFLDAGTQKLPVVPRSALKQDGETTRAFAVVDKHIEERILELGPAQGDVVGVVKGLRAGETIVAHPSDAIADGVEVK